MDREAARRKVEEAKGKENERGIKKGGIREIDRENQKNAVQISKY